ncbi:PREDICTED: uncharacterized protein LOC108779637 [Cyphomyrmex costatus]|uniref:uncharacterized protein LOC108779637 n=1 Tax=Cyphomyrmex costatus TaxID=456900 RepID=UPI0008523EB7|nr:PREDICTED: uncharacterized protein LOC108779637 [Cyphomyrmex costatus]
MGNNKIGDSGTNCQIKQTDYPLYRDTPNATDGDSSTSENPKFFRRILKYLVRSTARIKQSKKDKCNIIKKRSVSTCKSEEKVSVYTSLSSIIDNVIKSDAEVAVKLKRKMVDAITSTTRTSNISDKVTRENLSGTIEHFVHGTSYRYAEYAAKDVDNVVVERGCGPLCIGMTQSVTADGEFSLETSPDAFAEACEKRRQTDHILEEIAKVSDALTEKARLISAKEQAASILASVSATPAKYEMEEQICEDTIPLRSPSIIYVEETPTTIAKEKPTVIVEEKPAVVVEEKPAVVVEEKLTFVEEEEPAVAVKDKPTAVAVAVASTTVIQPEIHKKILESPPNHFAPNSRDYSASLDKSLNASDAQVKPLVENVKKTKTRTVSITYPERDDLLDTAAPVITRKKKEEKEELQKKSSLRRMLDKHVFTDKAENCVIINCIPKLKKKRPKSLDQPDSALRQKDTKTDVSRQKIVKKVDSFTKPSKMKKELVQITKDIPQEFVSRKKPKYRAKYRIDTSDIVKKEKKPHLKKVPKDFEISKYTCLVKLPEVTKAPKVFKDSERPTMEMYKDCCRTPSGYLEPTRYCKDLISSIQCRRPKYCDVWTTPCFSSEDTLNGALPQDSSALKYHANCHSLIDISSRCNIDANCTKHRVTFENSLCTNTYCKSDTKYCYPHLNNIDNVRMRYYHCNDICPVWNNNQQCGRDRSYYWTKGNLYFTHQWTSEHLLRYN